MAEPETPSADEAAMREAWEQLLSPSELRRGDGTKTYRTQRSPLIPAALGPLPLDDETPQTRVAEVDPPTPAQLAAAFGGGDTLSPEARAAGEAPTPSFDGTILTGAEDDESHEGGEGANARPGSAAALAAPTVPLIRVRGDSAALDGAEEESGVARYELLRQIGQGGMGAVHCARQLNLRREVAVKTVLSRTDIAAKADFLAEALITAGLDHPNIVPVHDLGVTDRGDLMLAMKLVGGQSWAEMLRAEAASERLADPERLERHLEILEQVCYAVSFAHARGVLHLDLKPSNVMIGEFGEVLVMDWGVAVEIAPGAESAERRGTSRNEVREPRGTPVYMPPELALGLGSRLGPATDVYLLGAILHEVLTGQPPHEEGGTLIGILSRAVASAPPRFREEVPAELGEICKAALRRERHLRLQTAEELRERLAGYRRHRESLVIAGRARAITDRCQAQCKVPKALDEVSRSALYADFAEAVAGFRQARELWSENPQALGGEREARLGYARFAMAQGDLNLAEAQLARAEAEDAEGGELALARDELRRAHRERAAREASARRLKASLLATAAMLIFGSVGYALHIASLNSELERQREAEAAARQAAEEQAAVSRELLQTFIVQVNDELDMVIGKSSREARRRLLTAAEAALDRVDFHAEAEARPRLELELELQRGVLAASLGRNGDALARFAAVLSRGEALPPSRELRLVMGIARWGQAMLAEADGRSWSGPEELRRGLDEVRAALPADASPRVVYRHLFDGVLGAIRACQRRDCEEALPGLAALAAEVAEDMAARDPDDVWTRLAAIGATVSQAQAEVSAGRREAALARLEPQLPAVIAFLAKNPGLFVANDLIVTFLQLSAALSYETGRQAEALSLANLVLEHIDVLGRLDPENSVVYGLKVRAASSLAPILSGSGQRDRLERVLRECLTGPSPVSSPADRARAEASLRQQLGDVLIAAEQPEEARSQLRAARELLLPLLDIPLARSSDALTCALCSASLGTIAASAGQEEAAREANEAALAALTRIPRPPATASLLSAQLRIALAQQRLRGGEPERAEALMAEAQAALDACLARSPELETALLLGQRIARTQAAQAYGRGDVEGAKAHIERAIGLIERLAWTDFHREQLLSLSHEKRGGTLEKLGEPRAAAEAFSAAMRHGMRWILAEKARGQDTSRYERVPIVIAKKAIAQWQVCLAAQPEDRALTLALARCHIDSACYYDAFALWAGALKEQSAAQELLAPLAEAHPEARLLLARSRILSAKHHHNLEQLAPSEASFVAGLAALEALCEDAPDDLERRYQLGLAQLLGIALFEGRAERPDTNTAAMRERAAKLRAAGLVTVEAGLEAAPEDPRLRSLAARFAYAQALAAFEAGRWEEAREACDRARVPDEVHYEADQRSPLSNPHLIARKAHALNQRLASREATRPEAPK